MPHGATRNAAYRAVAARDARFDGHFIIAVRTTGIYCRPSCPAVTPEAGERRVLPDGGGRAGRGYRACRRCLPDAVPGSPDWNVRADLAARAMRLIADGVVERDGVPGLARRLGYSERHLTRVLTAELGAAPLALARAHRAHSARLLIESTDLPFSDVAFAAGFASIRQFNDTVASVFAVTPSQLRDGAAKRKHQQAAPGSIALRLPFRPPMDAAGMLAFLAARAIPGAEEATRAQLRPHASAAARHRDRPADPGPAAHRLHAAADRPPRPGQRGDPGAPPVRPGRRPGGLRRPARGRPGPGALGREDLRASGYRARSTARRSCCGRCSASR